jgi:hypothetical protein
MKQDLVFWESLSLSFPPNSVIIQSLHLSNAFTGSSSLPLKQLLHLKIHIYYGYGLISSISLISNMEGPCDFCWPSSLSTWKYTWFGYNTVDKSTLFYFYFFKIFLFICAYKACHFSPLPPPPPLPPTLPPPSPPYPLITQQKLFCPYF